MNLNYQLTFGDFLALQMDGIKNMNYHRARYNVTLIVMGLWGFFIGLWLASYVLPRVVANAIIGFIPVH